MQNIVGLIEIDASASSAAATEQSGPLAMLLALAELLPETARTVGAIPYPSLRLRVCNFNLPVVFARLDLLSRDLDNALVELRCELEGTSTAA